MILFKKLKEEEKQMKIINKEKYNKGKSINTDDYGSSVYRFLERWADLMEAEINKGKKISDIAEATSNEADTEGITGFMYSFAINVLAHCWKYGEELQKWHNKKHDHEGEGVINSAIITIRKK